MSSKKPQPTPRLLSSPAVGAALLIAQQFGSRALTFIVNQILLRYLSPSTLGISTQLEVYSITALFFARESLRIAIQRQADVADEDPSITQNGKQKANKGRVEEKTASGRTQAIVNLAYISIALGIVFASGLALLYLRTLSAGDSAVLATPYFREALTLYGISVFVELLSEPCYFVVQQKSRFEIRASAEWIATLLRCLVTCGSTMWASRSGTDIGVWSFALGQVMYSISLSLVYYFSVWSIASSSGFSLLAKPIQSIDNQSFALSYFSRPLLSLSGSFFSQSIIKHFLTQGDTILISTLTSPQAQGVYALANNYGGLVARLILQPIEESSRNYFGKHLSTADGQLPSQSRVLEARRNLTKLLYSYIIISVVVIVAGPTIAPLLLRIVAGSVWMKSGAGDVLSIYCYYIPLLAINGITEAFVSSVATKSEIHHQTLWMSAFFAGFASAVFFFLRILDMGAKGLVWANVINMLFRIIWCTAFIKSYLERQGVPFEISTLVPKLMTIATGLGSYAAFTQIRSTLFDDSIMDLLRSGVMGVVIVIILGYSERTFILECFRTFRGRPE